MLANPWAYCGRLKWEFILLLYLRWGSTGRKKVAVRTPDTGMRSSVVEGESSARRRRADDMRVERVV